MRRAILSLPEDAWRPALRQNGEERDGAQVAEITHMLEFYDWPERSRVIVRRERPHPGAQLSFTDVDGHRFQATLTDLAGDAVELERLHRGRANAEDRVRAAKQTGLENLPFREFALNAVWLELSLIAQDLSVWTQALCLDGELATLRTQDAALPAAAHRRTARLPRPPRHAAPASQLALGQPARRRLRAPARAPATRRLTAAAGADDHTACTPRAQRPRRAVANTRAARGHHQHTAADPARRTAATAAPRASHPRRSRAIDPSKRLTHDRGLNLPDATPVCATPSAKRSSGLRQSVEASEPTSRLASDSMQGAARPRCRFARIHAERNAPASVRPSSSLVCLTNGR